MTRILVVDDDEPLRVSIVRDLRRQGYDVAEAASVEEALSALSGAPADVLLTDLRMNGADGIDLIKAARALSGDMRALLMSGFGTARDYQTAVDLGAVRVLCKPFTSKELSVAVRQAIECTTGFHGSVHGLALVDVLQMLHIARRTVTLSIDAGGATVGTVEFREGALVHAQLGEKVGEDAVRALLTLRSGALRTTIVHESGTQTITRDFQSVVLDALRVLDEQSTGQEWDLEAWDVSPEPSTAEPARGAAEVLREAWDLTWRQIAPASLDVFAVGVDLRAGEAVPLRGGGDDAAGTVTGLLAVVDRVCGESRFGVLDCSGRTSSVFVIWDRQRELAVVIGDLVRNVGETAMLRTAAWTLARHLLDAGARSINSGGTNGKDR